jgi:hypothetical protein
MSWFVYQHSEDKGYRIVGATDTERRGAEKLFAEWLPYGAVPESAAIVGHQRVADDLWYVIAKPAGTNSIHGMLADRATYRLLEFSPFSAALGAPCGAKLAYEAVPGPALRWAGAADERLATSDDRYLDLAQRLFVGLSDTDRMHDYISALPARGVATHSQFSRFELREGAALDRARVAALLRPLQAEQGTIGRLAGELTTYRQDVEGRLKALTEKIPPPSPSAEDLALTDRADKLEKRVAILETTPPPSAPPQPRSNQQASSDLRRAECLIAASLAIILLVGAAQYFLVSRPLSQRAVAADATIEEVRVKQTAANGLFNALKSDFDTLSHAFTDLTAGTSSKTSLASLAQDITTAQTGIADLGRQFTELTVGSPAKRSLTSLARDLDAAQASIQSLRRRLDELTSGTPKTTLASLAGEVSAVTSQVEALSKGLDALAGVREGVNSLASTLGALTLGAPQKISIRTILDQLDGMRKRLDALDLPPRRTIATLSAQIKCLEERLDAAGSPAFKFSTGCERRPVATPPGGL